jgi:hypothetical protein
LDKVGGIAPKRANNCASWPPIIVEPARSANIDSNANELPHVRCILERSID